MINKSKDKDRTELFHGALIQHGPLSRRIYLMKIKDADPAVLIDGMEELAAKNGYTKIFVKVPGCKAGVFVESGYLKEAEIPGFFNGDEAGVFLGRYLDEDRKKEADIEVIEKNLEICGTKKCVDPGELLAGAVMRKCVPEDAERMSEIYKVVFESYPFPIHNPDYLVETMLDHIIYFGVEVDGELVSLSSAETDPAAGNVEMTDFATLPDYRGNRFASHLLCYMEDEMRKSGFQTGYTIARAVSPAMNITFKKAGYEYGGRLVNNTNISGRIESMNIWFKPL